MKNENEIFIGDPDSILHREGRVLIAEITEQDVQNSPFFSDSDVGKCAFLDDARFLGLFDREEEAIEALAIWDMYG